MTLANNTTRAQRIILLTTIETIFRSNQLPRAARNIIINKKNVRGAIVRTMRNIHKGARYFFVVPSNICLGFNLHTITSQLKPFCSPVRLSPAIGVMSITPQNATSIFGDPVGAHYRSSIQELLHLVATFTRRNPLVIRICSAN